MHILSYLSPGKHFPGKDRTSKSKVRTSIPKVRTSLLEVRTSRAIIVTYSLCMPASGHLE